MIVNTNKKDTKESVKCYANHKKPFNLIKSKNGTTLSMEYWNLKQNQQAPRLTWEVKGLYKAYNPTLKKCNLCLYEKFVIIDNPHKNLLNKRSEVISQFEAGEPHVLENSK